MKKFGIVLGIWSTSLLFKPFVGSAQTTTKTSTQNNTNTSYAVIEKRAQELTQKAAEELELTSEQKSKYKKFAMSMLYNLQLVEDKIQSTSDEKEKAKLEAQKKQIDEEFWNNIKSILTPEQQERLQEL